MKKAIILLSAAIAGYTGFSQSIGIGTTNPNSSAQLDISSTSKGILIPRMTKSQKQAIAAPAAGLMIFQSGPDSTGFQFFDGTRWNWIPSTADMDSVAWRTGGNTGTNANTQFMGTRDNRPLAFRINNQKAGIIDTTGTLAFGRGALYNNPATKKNTAFGDSALFKNGIGATFPVQSVNNTAVGDKALKENTTGSSNTAVGSMALSANTSGLYNTALGDLSLKETNTGNGNTALGYNTLSHNKANGNTAIGSDVLYNNITGAYNVAIGTSSLAANDAGNENIAIGVGALSGNINGNDNIAIGASALEANESGHHNIAIGKYALLYSDARNNLIAIGDSALMYNSLNATAPVEGTANIGIGLKNLFNNTTGYNNISIGQLALTKNTTGSRNIAIGNAALINSTTKSGLVAIGDSSLYNNSIGSTNAFQSVNNSAIGDKSLYSNTTGGQNTAVGAQALYGVTTGSENTAIGYKALENVTSYYNTAVGSNAAGKTTAGTYITAVGYNAAASNTTGSAVTTVGYQAGYLNTTGTLNTAIGFFAAFGSGNLTNATAIGANATVNSSNSLVLGSNAKVGIGLSSPVATLHVKKLAAADSGIVFQGTDNSTVFFTDNITENLLLQAGKNGSDVIINPTPGGKIRLGGLAQNNVTEVAGKMYANELGGVLGSSFNMVPLGIVSFDASETDDYLSSNAHATFTNLVGNLGTSVSAFGGSNITSADDLGCLVNLNTTVMTGYSSYFVTGTVNYAGNGATGNAYAVASELQLLPPGGAVTNYRVRVWYRVDDFPNVGTCHVFGNFMVYGIR